MNNSMLPLPGLSSASGKPVVVKFDGGLLSSDGGVLALREVEQRLRVADRLAACMIDPRAVDQITHSLADVIRFRLLMISVAWIIAGASHWDRLTRHHEARLFEMRNKALGDDDGQPTGTQRADNGVSLPARDRQDAPATFAVQQRLHDKKGGPKAAPSPAHLERTKRRNGVLRRFSAIQSRAEGLQRAGCV